MKIFFTCILAIIIINNHHYHHNIQITCCHSKNRIYHIVGNVIKSLFFCLSIIYMKKDLNKDKKWIPYHLICTVEQLFRPLSGHNYDAFPFLNVQNVEQTVHHDLKTHKHHIKTCAQFYLIHDSDYLSLPCFLGRSTVNLCSTSLVFPQRIPNKAPLPSITIKPNLLSSANKAFKACGK